MEDMLAQEQLVMRLFKLKMVQLLLQKKTAQLLHKSSEYTIIPVVFFQSNGQINMAVVAIRKLVVKLFFNMHVRIL
jgi:hypothetical protein